MTVGGPLVRRDLAAAWDVPFEVADRPVRTLRSHRGQRSDSSWWWMASSARHVGYESWLERDNVIVLDADPDVAAAVSQPFRLWWSDGVKPRPRLHVPDYFVRRTDGGVVIIDVRADDRIGDDDAALFAVTEVTCRAVGWEYRRVGEVDPVRSPTIYDPPTCADICRTLTTATTSGSTGSRPYRAAHQPRCNTPSPISTPTRHRPARPTAGRGPPFNEPKCSG
ncbi:TnsA-like heteromeric transposase endonuclease subunit [Nocardia sp. NBC_01377]|uniref:TnsA-like heteromeric transposase endonuclease subunit n=1 Tax=Nocardia sp. NBC_01377 TaxID=2903595 RepID=UPI0032455E9F